MSALLHIVLTVVEILALVIALAVYLVILARQLRAVADTISQLGVRVRATEQRLRDLGPAAGEVNAALEDLRSGLRPVSEKASRMARL